MLSKKPSFIALEPMSAPSWDLMGEVTVETDPDQEPLRQGIELEEHEASQSKNLPLPQAQQTLTEQCSQGINRLPVSVTLRPSALKGSAEEPIKLQAAASYRLSHFPHWIFQYRANSRLEVPDDNLSSSDFRAEKFWSQSYCVRTQKNISVEYSLKVSKACYSWLGHG